MTKLEETGTIGLSEELDPECMHICLIYDNENHRKKIVSEYLAAGLRQGELVRYGADVATPEHIRSWLFEMGVEFPEDNENGPFRIFKAEDYYCPHGRFEPKELIDAIPFRNSLLKKAGYKGVRSSTEMSWALRGIPGSERLLEYEALLNTVYPRKGMCQYDTRLFDGAMLFNVLKVHPYMVAQGQIVRNPFYIRPEEFQAGLSQLK